MIGQKDAILRLESLGCEVWFDQAFRIIYWGEKSGPGPGDEDVAAIRELAPLSTLSLRSSPITDRGLEELTTCLDLTHLALDCCNVTDRGLASIGRMERLTVLSLTDTQVTGEGLQHLAALKSLHTLLLDGTAIDGRGLAVIPKLTALRDLNLSHTRCGDHALPHVTSAPWIEKLRWNYSPLTEEGVRRLASIRGLRLLELRGVPVPPSGAAWLRKSLQGCEIRLPQ